MEHYLPEPLAVCLEDGLAHDDATLVDQDGGRHPVSKLILAVNSKFFLALFSRSHEDENYPITIMKRSSSTAEGLALVLSWMVRGEVEVTEENVLEVLQTAEYLHVEPVSHFCQQVILSLCTYLFLTSPTSSGWLLSWTPPTPSGSVWPPRTCS